ncbi:MAG: endolytic transglycosylase MltG [Acidimicrobiia bacterium]|nr:endolytic transglycosylase MltG [Acidimicrobiia bacterium]
MADIADELDRSGVIGSSLVFQAYVRLSGSGPFQAGDYELRRGLGVKDSIAVLEDGPVITYEELRVPPGLWLSEIAERVEEQLPGRSAARFLEVAASGRVRSRYQPDGEQGLEGLLWPDTYRFVETDDETAVLRTMVREFDRRAGRLGLDAPAGGLSAYQTLIVASLVQSEAKVDSDRSLIASVIMNRLEQDMPLQIDATVLYAIGERKISNTADDRATESPYNTYLVRGLPPTPISSVAEVSIEAALNPAESEYLFYVVADAEGRHAFAETYDEHLVNVEAAREKGLLG